MARRSIQTSVDGRYTAGEELDLSVRDGPILPGEVAHRRTRQVLVNGEIEKSMDGGRDETHRLVDVRRRPTRRIHRRLLRGRVLELEPWNPGTSQPGTLRPPARGRPGNRAWQVGQGNPHTVRKGIDGHHFGDDVDDLDVLLDRQPRRQDPRQPCPREAARIRPDAVNGVDCRIRQSPQIVVRSGNGLRRQRRFALAAKPAARGPAGFAGNRHAFDTRPPCPWRSHSLPSTCVRRRQILANVNACGCRHGFHQRYSVRIRPLAFTRTGLRRPLARCRRGSSNHARSSPLRCPLPAAQSVGGLLDRSG